MELKDALVPFLPAGMPALQDNAHAPTCIRVALLTERPALKTTMQRMLSSNRYMLTQVCSAQLIEKAIEKRICDVAVVDIERQDQWPGSVFSRFDEAGASVLSH